MKAEKQHKKKENQELKEWKKPELKVLDKRETKKEMYTPNEEADWSGPS